MASPAEIDAVAAAQCHKPTEMQSQHKTYLHTHPMIEFHTVFSDCRAKLCSILLSCSATKVTAQLVIEQSIKDDDQY